MAACISTREKTQKTAARNKGIENKILYLYGIMLFIDNRKYSKDCSK